MGPTAFPLFQPDLFDQGRYEEQSDKQGYGEVDNHHGCKVLQVQPYLLVKEEDDHQSSHCSQSSYQDRHKGFQVTPVQDMVGHHNRIVYHQIERNRNTYQRIELHLQPKKIIENDCYRNIDAQADYNQE